MNDFEPTDVAQARARNEQKEVMTREMAGAYLRTFATADGKKVLGDLRRKFGLQRLVFRPNGSGRYDYLDAALRDGERHVMIEIESALLTAGNGTPPL